ncbi:MAG: hypothetical protein FWE85_03505 [Clostridiales bacterium]|nr:hypothetical protein [Clostridiales bacterium]
MKLLLLFLSALIALAVWREGLLTGLLLMAAALFFGLCAALFCYGYSSLRQKAEERWKENP